MAGPTGKPKAHAAPTVPLKLRLDKWLLAARFFKSRDMASSAIEEGHLRINGQPCRKAGHGVGPGDVLTFVQAGRVRLIRITAVAQRRGSAQVAQTLYVDLDAPLPQVPDLA